VSAFKILNIIQQESRVPYILIQVTKEGLSKELKEVLIREATDLMVRTLNKDPATTFVLIEEVETDNWGVGGMSVTEMRKRKKKIIKEFK
jgi:4-oxalocrotonate tautomerase